MQAADQVPGILLPVPEDEMAFALSYFVASAEHKLAGAEVQEPGSETFCDCLFLVLYRTMNAFATQLRSVPRPARRRVEARLQDTFKAVCFQYQGSEHLVSICVRVLAFYLLMERSAGMVLAEWTQVDAGDDRYITLPPAVIQALAAFPMDGTGSIPPDEFAAFVRQRAAALTAGGGPA